MKEIVVLGAGLTGLVTAYHLRKRGFDVIVLEKADRPGGVIHSVREAGFLYEEGPNSGVIGNSEVNNLFEELEADCEMDIATPHVKKRYVLKDGKWEPLPGSFKTAVTTPLFSWKDKFRILLEPFRAAGKDPHETLAGLVRRRMGQSFLDYAIDPFIIGVYAGDPARLVPKYALPKLYNLEQQYGSFVGGSIKKQFQTAKDTDKKVNRAVFSVSGGISSLIHALVKNIGEERILLNCNEVSVVPSCGHYELSYRNRIGKSITMKSRKVISTLGAHQLGETIPFIGKDLLSKITTLHYTRVIEIVIGFEKWKGMELDAFGGLIPFAEKRNLLGILFMSSLFTNRAPEGGALFSIFMGGVRRPDIYQLPDQQIREILQDEFCNLMGLDDFHPDLLKIFRHNHAIPQYEADSGERFQAISMVEDQFPGLLIGGNARDGIGMADRILQAKKLAEIA